jgi:hypothetical protein
MEIDADFDGVLIAFVTGRGFLDLFVMAGKDNTNYESGPQYSVR